MSTFDLNPLRTGSIVYDSVTLANFRSIGAGGSDAEFSDFTNRLFVFLISSAGGRGVADASLDSHPLLTRVSSGSSASSVVSSFSAMVIDFVRCRTPVSSITTTLEEFGFKAARVASFSASFSTHADALRRAMEAAGET